MESGAFVYYIYYRYRCITDSRFYNDMRGAFFRLLNYLLWVVICVLAIPSMIVILLSIADIAMTLFIGGLLVLPLLLVLIFKDWLNENIENENGKQ